MDTAADTDADADAPARVIRRHVRTGAYDGTETIVIPRTGKIVERPRALTECGEKSAGGDYSPVSGKLELIDGRTHEMCPACIAKLEARGARNLSQLPDRRGSSTPKQRNFIRRLIDEAARNGRPYLVEARDIDQMSSRSASAKIDELKMLKERGWRESR